MGPGDVGAVERRMHDVGPHMDAQNEGETDCSRGHPSERPGAISALLENFKLGAQWKEIVTRNGKRLRVGQRRELGSPFLVVSSKSN